MTDDDTFPGALARVVEAVNGGEKRHPYLPPERTENHELDDRFRQLAQDMADATVKAGEHTAKQIEEQAERLMNEARSFEQRSKLEAERVRQQAQQRAAKMSMFIGQQLRESSLALDAVASRIYPDDPTPPAEDMQRTS